MKTGQLIAVLLTAALAATVGQAEKKPKMPDAPEVLATARTVAVVSRDGGERDLRVSEEDRMAIAAVSNALIAWGRYRVVQDLSQADVVLVVMKARPQQQSLGQGRDPSGASRGVMDLGDNGDSLGRASQPSRNPVSTDVTATADTLWVCLRDAKGRLGNPLWVRSLDGGLDGQPMLVAQLRTAVEKAFPPTPKP